MKNGKYRQAPVKTIFLIEISTFLYTYVDNTVRSANEIITHCRYANTEILDSHDSISEKTKYTNGRAGSKGK
jgi:hypothetical protein